MQERLMQLVPSEYSKEQIHTFRDAVQGVLGNSSFDRAAVDFKKDFDDETLAHFMKHGVLPHKYQVPALKTSVVGRVREALTRTRVVLIVRAEQKPAIVEKEQLPSPDPNIQRIIAGIRAQAVSPAPHPAREGGLKDRVPGVGAGAKKTRRAATVDPASTVGDSSPVARIEPVPGHESGAAADGAQEVDANVGNPTRPEMLAHREKLRAALVAAGVRTRPVVEALGRGREVMGDALMRKAEKIFAPKAVEKKPVGGERAMSRDDIVREMRKPGAVRPDVINALTSAGWSPKRVDDHLVLLYYRNRGVDLDEKLFADARTVLKRSTKPKGGSSTKKTKK